MAVLWSVWKERNARIFVDKEENEEKVWQRVNRCLRCGLSLQENLVFFQLQISFVIGPQRCFKGI